MGAQIAPFFVFLKLFEIVVDIIWICAIVGLQTKRSTHFMRKIKQEYMQGRKKALQVDKDFYADCEDGSWYVFGDNSGFAYRCCDNKADAEEIAGSMRKYYLK